MSSCELFLQLTPLDEATKRFAEEELRETPEIARSACEELRCLLRNDQSMWFADDEDFLLIFLRPCKFYASSAHKLMRQIAEFKLKHKSLLSDLLPENEKESFNSPYNILNVLKDRDQKGRRILVVNCGAKWDPSKFNSDKVMRIFFLTHEMAVLEPESQVRGVVVLLDFNGLGMKQVMAITPAFGIKLLGFIQDAMPLRLKEVHIVKQPFIFNMVWKIFKPLVGEKLKKRLYFHGNKMESLHEFLAPTHLPEDYDGVLPKINYGSKEWFPRVVEHTEHIKKMNACGFVGK